MNIESLNKQINIDNITNMADLFTSCFAFDPTVGLLEYTLTRDDEMRIDTLMSNLYEYDPIEADLYLNNLDVILYINGIDNPLNLVEGLVIKYPDFADINKFRTSDVNNDFNKKSDVAKKLSFPNKKTRKDKSRESYIKDGYSLPPVVLETPRDPVRLKNGKFSIGGL